VELKDLVGEHVLDAVDFSNEQVKIYGDEFEPCQVMRFRLDGKVYTALEDPGDGYRSSMRDLFVGEHAMTNVFTPTRVLAVHRTTGMYSGQDDVLELRDMGTGKVIVEVGTDNVDDYYPAFVANFAPENMTANARNQRKP